MFRDWSFIAARSNVLQIQLPPHEAEVMGFWEALSWIKSSVHSLVLLEMDDAQGVFKTSLIPL